MVRSTFLTLLLLAIVCQTFAKPSPCRKTPKVYDEYGCRLPKLQDPECGDCGPYRYCKGRNVGALFSQKRVSECALCDIRKASRNNGHAGYPYGYGGYGYGYHG